jgi:glycosyltransferase involved in cell wall biosynthesis
MSRQIILFGPLPPPYGGVAIYMQSLVAHLRAPNVSVWTYGGAKPDDKKIRFIAHRRLGTLWALLAAGRNARILDASHFHLEYPNPLLLLVWLGLKRRLGFEWFKNILDGSLPKRYPEFGWLQRRLFHRAIAAVDEFVVVSEELRYWLNDEIKVQQPITVIPCLVPPPDRDAKLSNEAHAIITPYLAREHRVCSIGVFSPSYGFKDVAEAVEELRERTRKDIGLLLLDGGFICDEVYRREVLWKREWVTVLKEIPNPQIYEILKRSDVFVRSVVDEGFGISRIEAIWSGTPVIATRVGETRGMLLYDFGDVEQLVNQLQAVLLYPVWEEPNPWAAEFRREAEKNLQAVAKLLGIESSETNSV